jgi:hypothetical protein
MRADGRWRGVRGRERTGSTRTHPEPGRDPVQRRRVLRGRPRGRRGRCGHPPGVPPPTHHPAHHHSGNTPLSCRGVEQRQLVGLITQRSRVRIPPPPLRNNLKAIRPMSTRTSACSACRTKHLRTVGAVIDPDLWKCASVVSRAPACWDRFKSGDFISHSRPGSAATCPSAPGQVTSVLLRLPTPASTIKLSSRTKRTTPVGAAA